MEGKSRDFKRYLSEARLVLFFLGATFLIFFAFFSIREISFFKGTYVITATFDFAEGLKPASPVRFCGVDVGEVKSIEVKERASPTVYVDAKIARGISIPRNSKFFINSLSLFGEKYLEIIPPDSIDGYLDAEEVVSGESSVPLYNIFATFQKTMLRLDSFVSNTNLQDSLDGLLNNARDFTKQLNSLLLDVRAKKGTIGRLFYDDSLYTKTEEMLEDLKAHPWKLLHKPKEEKK